ncbi:MAG: hypothetical protein EPN20_10770 [Magnetospirillum sp.]|nr:MAG: hypothetical protein EPN20_10770 [Magnetospirillum sp.]
MAKPDDPMQALIASWLEDGKTHRHQDYLGRGQCYARLSDDLLLRSWSISRQCSQICPGDPDLMHEQADLTSEMELRGLRVPSTPGYDAFQTLLDSEIPVAEETPFSRDD